MLCSHGWQIAPATYYAAKSRPPSARAVRDEQLKAVIATVHRDNYGVCGARKMQAAVRREQGLAVGRDQVGRLMRELGLAGVRRGQSKRTTMPSRPPSGRRTWFGGSSAPAGRITWGSAT